MSIILDNSPKTFNRRAACLRLTVTIKQGQGNSRGGTAPEPVYVTTACIRCILGPELLCVGHAENGIFRRRHRPEPVHVQRDETAAAGL